MPSPFAWNPKQESPRQPTVRPPETKPYQPTDGARQPFYVQAARFSFWAPFVMGLMNIVLQRRVLDELQYDSTVPLVVIIAGIVGTTMMAGIVLGMFGFVVSARRREWSTMTLAVIGIVLDIVMLIAP